MKKKSRRRILSLLMAMILLIGTLHVPGLTLKVQADTVRSGSCGDGVTYVLDSDGQLTISKTGDGTGEMTSFPWRDDPNISAQISRVVIENGVTSICDWAFTSITSLTSVTIPGTVTEIGWNAFYNCSMSSIDLPEGLEKIGAYAFEECEFLTSVTIPKSVTDIRNGAFSMCSRLSSINVHEDNQYYCSKDGVLYSKDLTRLAAYPAGKTDVSYIIPDTVEEIAENSFEACEYLKEITIPQSVTEIEGAFYYCTALTSITVPGGVTTISSWEFAGCTALKSIVLEDGVEIIYDKAFSGCTALEELTLPKSISKIYETAFEECTKLKTVCYMGNTSDWSKVDKQGNTFGDGVTIQYNGGGIVNSGDCGADVQYELNNQGVLTISGTGAVTSHPWENSDIRKVKIGSGVTDVTAAGFINCTLLEDISVEEANTVYSSADGILFNKNKTEIIQYPCNKEGDEYTVPDSVTVIGDYTFVGCSNLTGISLPDGVTTIGTGAFSKCSELAVINIPDSVTDMKAAAFFRGTSLEDISIPEGVKAVKNRTFAGCSKLKSITFSDSVISIEEDAFNNCSSLTDVYYGGAGTKWNTLQSNIAANNISLTNAKIHYMKGSCGSNAAWTLTKDGVLTISGIGETEWTAGECWKPEDVKKLIIEEGIKAIGDEQFSDCQKLTEAEMAGSVTEIGDWSFYCCYELTDIVIPENVTSVGEGAFAECMSLKNVTIPVTVSKIEADAFSGCTSLSDVYYGGTEEDWNKIAIDGNGNDLLIGANIHYMVFVIGVSVTPTTLELRVGESGTLTAMVAPEDATNKKVNWTSSAPEVATVADGVVTAVAEGESIITVTTADGEKTATCKVTVAGIPVTGVSIAPETLSLKIGGSGTLAATVSPENATNKKVSWTSSTPEVATVADGVVTAVAEGESIITVTTEDGAKKATCKVTVSSKDINVSEVSITPETLSLKIGESGTLTATVSPENATNKKLNWTSSAPEVATVADGVVTAVAEGESIITVTTEDGGKTATCKVTVTKAEEVVDSEDPEKTSEPKIPEGPLGPEKPDLSRYTASGNEMAVKSINLKKTIFKDVKGIKKFNVTGGDASAVKIKGGNLMVLKDATVTIEAVDKKKEKLAEKTITVIAPAIDSVQATEINRRGTLDLNKYILSTVQPSGWKSSNKNVAAVSENGLLIIKKSGTVKLTATFPAEKGMTAKKLTIKLKVKMPQFKKTTYTLKTGKTIKTAVKNADEAGITYRTEDTAIATVDATGSVTGVSKGTTKLIMTVKGIDYETKIKVK